ncbi:hypothetical protein KP509_02G076600 [Ceratopteris richardii]|uniref:START domain-containing protein n=1 Tax=Ceratopteris richardii TaxID=49495 RepID=A0A8T2VEI3_CERRI|nr:hypothetical protein KP509_02G076600 [Ceratopteris richardii]
MALMKVEQADRTSQCKWKYRWIMIFLRCMRRGISVCGVIMAVLGGGLLVYRVIVPRRLAEAVDLNLESLAPVDEDLKPSIHENRSLEIESGESSGANSSNVNGSLLITDEDAIVLEKFFEKQLSNEWSEEIRNSTPTLLYELYTRSPKGGGPLQYLSVTRYLEPKDTTQVMMFVANMNALKKAKYVETFETLDIYKETGIEIWHAVRSYPFGKRDYVAASRIWKNEADGSYLCCTKGCPNHPKAPKATCTRVDLYYSAWRIKQVPRGGVEVKMYYTEDTKSNLSSFGLLFHSKIWSYVKECEKMLSEYIKNEYNENVLENASKYVQALKK